MALAAGVVLVAPGALASAAPADPATVPPTLPPTTVVPGDPATTTPPVDQGSVVLPPAQGPLVIVPTGCASPAPATAVFEGEIEVLSVTAARFHVRRQLAGTLDGHLVAPDTVDVIYGSDARFLAAGDVLVVGVVDDPAVGGLTSKVREPAPLFGGDAVVGLDDTDVDCPKVEDPVRTLHPDGTTVDSGVLRTLDGAGPNMLRALMAPVAIALLVLITLVLLKHLVFAIGRSLRDMGDVQPAVRTRRHGSTGDEPLA